MNSFGDFSAPTGRRMSLIAFSRHERFYLWLSSRAIVFTDPTRSVSSLGLVVTDNPRQPPYLTSQPYFRVSKYVQVAKIYKSVTGGD